MLKKLSATSLWASIGQKKTAASRLGLMLAATLLATNTLADVAPLSVSGNKILIGGSVGSLAGNSLFWSNTGWGGDKFYTAGTVAWLKNDWKSKVIRTAMGVEENGGYIGNANSPADSANKARTFAVIDAAIANDMYVIVDWHTHHAENFQSQAIAFFREVASKYGTNHHIIYEIYNEPLNISWVNVLKPYATAVIGEIRAIDPDNLIIVGTPNWSQDVDIAASSPITGFKNIAYTLHFYAGSHRQSLRDKAQIALNKGVPLFVTEWGSVEASGGGAVDTAETNNWMAFLKTNNISHANWALNDKAEGSAALMPGASANGGWTPAQLTASGSLVKNIMVNWPSVTASASSSSSSSSSNSSSSSSSGGGRSSSSSSSSSSGRSSSSSSSSSSSGGGGMLAPASCTYIVTNQWATGYTAEVRLTNLSTSTINAWDINWKYATGALITSSWNATVSNTAGIYRATPLSWNGNILPNTTVTVGFQGNKSSAPAEVPKVLGSVCR